MGAQRADDVEPLPGADGVPVAAVVLSVDEAARLEESLPAAAGARLVVVENACTDGSADVARRQGARGVLCSACPEGGAGVGRRHAAGVVSLGHGATYADAMNAGVAAALGEPGV